jgi:DNA polymerase I-like protein with 3'-5' exonuclease and polymerase domains
VPLVTVDFETFYSSHIGFKKQTTEEYINDPLFQVIGVGIKVDDGVTTWHAGEDAGKALRAIDWASSAVLCHNTLFDGAILTWRYGIKPAYLFDTLSMARAVHGVEAGGSLAALAERYALGEKGTEVVNAFGKRLEDFSPEDLAKYGEYCINDVELTYKLFHKLAAGFPESELDLIDMTLRMFTEPQLQLDDALMVDRLEAIQQEKHDLLTQLTDELGTNEEGVRKILASNPKFAEILRTFHVKPPMKISSTTGKETYAFAKTDEEFIALQEHEDPFVRLLCAVRLGTKSTIEESRIERFINVGKRNKGSLPVPLKYYGAHTGRWSGMDAVNLQNLPSRDKAKKALKNAIIAPLDSVVINCDSSQIEARVLAWLSGQDDVVDQFARGEDVYSIFASKVYGFEVSKEFPTERFVGKTCVLGLGYGTGAAKLRHTLATQPPGADIELEESERIVRLYRDSNYRIVDLWGECNQTLRDLCAGVGKPYYLGKHKCVIVCDEGLKLPNGMYIRYKDLRADGRGHVYSSRKGPVNIWGGAMVENVVQALARIIVGEQMRWISKQYRVALTVHDAAVLVVPETELSAAKEYVELCMSTPPAWAKGLPVACELKFSESYGRC